MSDFRGLTRFATLFVVACNVQNTTVRHEAGVPPITPADPAPAQPGASAMAPSGLQPSETRPKPPLGAVRREAPAPNVAVGGASGAAGTNAQGGAGGASAVPGVGRAAAPKTASNERECKACRGVWAKHGLSKTFSCNCATSDGGKRCKDGAECEGVCAAADEPEREVVEKGPPPRGYFVGRCSKLVTVFGCYRPIERGASATPVDLTTPPQMICAD